MRDSNRIVEICKLLEDAWKKEPEQRLGQFLINHIFGDLSNKIFYLEDIDVEEKLKAFIIEYEKGLLLTADGEKLSRRKKDLQEFRKLEGILPKSAMKEYLEEKRRDLECEERRAPLKKKE